MRIAVLTALAVFRSRHAGRMHSVEQLRVERRGQLRRSGRARPNPRRRRPRPRRKRSRSCTSGMRAWSRSARRRRPSSATLEVVVARRGGDPEGGGDDRRPCRQVAQLVPGRAPGPTSARPAPSPRSGRIAEDFAAKDRDFPRPLRPSTPPPRAANLDAIKSGFADLGKTCKACHDKYRKEMHH